MILSEPGIINKDPLLFNPCADENILFENLLISSNDNYNKKKQIKISIEEFAEDNLNLITKYLSLKEVSSLMIISKSFSRLTKQQLIRILEDDKSNFATYVKILA